jgi:hypothetical protein
MSFAYIPGDSTDLADIRAAIGDIDSSRPVGQRLEDEEIARAIARVGSGVQATLECVRQLKARMWGLVSERTIGSLTLKWAQSRYQVLAGLERDLMRTAVMGARPYAGGISQGDKDAEDSNIDRAEPAFKRGMLDNPEAGSQTPGDSSVTDGTPV